MRVERITVGPFQTNCYIVETGGNCYIVDPGGDIHIILEKLKNLECEPTAIIATHAHFDHVLGVKDLKIQLEIPFIMHAADLPILLGQPEFVRNFWGFELPNLIDRVDRFVDEGDRLNSDLVVMHTPGHSPGSISLVGNGFLITGDVIFKDGYGRTDLPGGDTKLLARSIERILSFDDKTLIYPGHGPVTTVGECARKLFFR